MTYNETEKEDEDEIETIHFCNRCGREIGYCVCMSNEEMEEN